MLLEKGADATAKDKYGETAADWAKKFSNPAIMKALGLGVVATAPTKILDAGETKPDLRQSVEKSVALLQRTSGTFFKEGGCVACHAQDLTAMAVQAARPSGIRIDEAAHAEQMKAVQLQWTSFEQMLLRGNAERLFPRFAIAAR